VLLQVIAQCKTQNRIDYDEKGPPGETFLGGPNCFMGRQLARITCRRVPLLGKWHTGVYSSTGKVGSFGCERFAAARLLTKLRQIACKQGPAIG
jgi:hypothetical protein